MLKKLGEKIFGTSDDREIKKMQKLVNKINEIEPIFEKLTDGLASEMIDVNYDPDKFDSERKALLNGTQGHYTHEFTKKFQD